MPSSVKGLPFKGFLDMSLVSQKMRKINNSELKIDKGAFKKRHNSVAPNKSRNVSPSPEDSIVPQKKLRIKTSKPDSSMNPKVLENWIN